MHPFINIFGRNIAVYGLSLVTAGIVGFVALSALMKFLPNDKNNKISPNDMCLLFIIIIPGIIVGGFTLRPLMKIPGVIINWDVYRNITAGELLNYIFGEFVFYGGLIGGILFGLLFCLRFRIPVLPAADLVAPIIPLCHAIGRIGCLFGGCCYGVETSPDNPFAIVYPPESFGAPPGVPRIALPLIEAAILVVISAAVFFVIRANVGKADKSGAAAVTYLMLYSITRFFIEFYRGDIVRGQYGPLSTSQIISILLFVLAIVIRAVIVRKKKI